MGRKKKIVNNEYKDQIIPKKLEGQTEGQILEEYPIIGDLDIKEYKDQIIPKKLEEYPIIGDLDTKNSLEGKFLLVKVGNENRPANDEDLKDLSEKIDNVLKNNNINCAVLVTHHAVDINIIG
jgi:hypothetical protein